MATEINTTLYDEDDKPIYVTGTFVKGMRARRDEYGAPESPDDEDECHITKAENEAGEEIQLTDEETEQALEQLANNE